MGQDARANPFNQWKTAEKDGVSQFKVYDGYGREIGKDDLLLWPSKTHVEWRVQEIRPSLHPQQPGLQMVLVAVSPLIVQGGVPLLDVFKVLDAEQVRDKLKRLGQEPTP